MKTTGSAGEVQPNVVTMSAPPVGRAATPFLSIAALHSEFSRPLMRFFRNCRLCAADAEDLTQEVFVRLSSAQSPLALRDPGAFVFTLARNLVRDRSRRLYIRALANSVAAEDAALTCNRPGPEERLEQQELLGQVQRVLDTLKPKSRDAFVMHRIDGESYANIAAGMDISISMVEKHVMAAMAALRRLHGALPARPSH